MNIVIYGTEKSVNMPLKLVYQQLLPEEANRPKAQKQYLSLTGPVNIGYRFMSSTGVKRIPHCFLMFSAPPFLDLCLALQSWWYQGPALGVEVNLKQVKWDQTEFLLLVHREREIRGQIYYPFIWAFLIVTSYPFTVRRSLAIILISWSFSRIHPGISEQCYCL